MQYYEKDTTKYKITDIGESTTALGSKILGFKFNIGILQDMTFNTGNDSNELQKITVSSCGMDKQKVWNDLGNPDSGTDYQQPTPSSGPTSNFSGCGDFMGDCTGGVAPSGACNWMNQGSDATGVGANTIFKDITIGRGFCINMGTAGILGHGFDGNNGPWTYTCDDESCQTYQFYGADACGGTDPPSSCGDLNRGMTGPPSPTNKTGNLLTCQDLAVAVKNGYLYTEGNTFLGKGGCSAPGCDKAMELDKDGVIAKECPYLLGFKSRTVSNTLYFVGPTSALKLCQCDIGSEPWANCPYRIIVMSETDLFYINLNWQNWLIGENFLGGRILNPARGTDYSLQSDNCDSPDSYGTGCKGASRCETTPTAAEKNVRGTIRGEWTFPLLGQNTSSDKDLTQDTLNYFSTHGITEVITDSLSSKFRENKYISQDPTKQILLPPMSHTGFISWIADMVNSIDSYNVGFIRDYMIVKTFASIYCTTLYGNISPNKSLKKTALATRSTWGYNLQDFRDAWQGNPLLSEDAVSPFGNMLFDRISSSFDTTKTTQRLLPYHSLLKSMTMMQATLKPFEYKGGIMYLTLPLDAFRMWDLCKTGKFDTSKFEDNIIVPLLGTGMKGSNGKTPVKEVPPNFIWKNKQISYSGLTYNDLSIFTKKMKTKTSDYDATPSPLPIITDVSVIDSDLLWPLDTHAIIDDNNVITSASNNGDKKPYIECLYYVTMGIKTWSPGLAFLYLATPDSPRDPAVYQQIVNDTKLVPSEYVGDLCNQNEMTKCQKLITKACNMVYTNPNFSFSPDSYFLLYNGRYSQGVCACINSSLVPPSKKIYDDPTAMCFDQNCTLPIPNTTNPIITMNDLLGLNDTYCRTQCNTLKSVLEGEASNIQNLNVSRYKRLCGQSINVTFNTSFFIQLMIPTIIISALIPLGFGINTTTIIITVLTLLTLTGVSFYLGKLFAPMTECDGIGAGGKLPICVSSLNNDMELPVSFCDINMFCECRLNGDCNDGCKCRSGVCVDKSGTRATETAYVKTINVQMLVLSCSLLILVPILIYLLRKRFFPNLSGFFTFCMIVLSIGIFGVTLYLSIVYEKPRISYKGICGQKPSQPPK